MRDPDELLATWNDGADELLASMPPLDHDELLASMPPLLDPDELLASVVELDRRAEAALAAELGIGDAP
jgi:hypothetical protein